MVEIFNTKSDMNTLKSFLEKDAGELLQSNDMVVLVGGNAGAHIEEVNALADCTNNCHEGNCVAQCGCKVEQPTQPTQTEIQ